METRGDDGRAAGTRPGKKELRRALGEAVDGWRTLEREFELDGRPAADVLGVDGGGRLWLAVLVRRERDAARVLAALALARRGAGPLERLVRAGGGGAAEVDRERAPGVVAVAPAYDAGLVERLAPLAALGVRLATVSRVSGRSGAVLVTTRVPGPRPGAAAAAAAAARPGLGAFLGALPAADAERAERLLTRLARLDEDLHHDARDGTVVVSIEGRALCTLTAPGGRLAGAVASERPGAEPRPLTGPADVERFVEDVVGRYLAVADPSGTDEDDGLGPLPDLEMTPPGPAQLLSREEIEAFHG